MYIFLAATYLVKNRRTVVILSGLSLIANVLAYLLLGAWTGMAMCVVAGLRNLYIMYDERKNGETAKLKRKDYIFLAVVYLGIIGATFLTFEGWLSLLSVFATSLYTYSIWQKSVKVYKFCGIPVGILWILYNIYVKSAFGVILEAVLLIFSAVGYFRELRQGTNKTTQSESE